jgi:environmental stress-induced protein Ves
MRILRAAEYPTQPWKNGGGLTREILKVPAEGVAFDWRLSLATIEAPGPFSNFAGYTRTLVLVDGAGVHLDFGAHGSKVLRTAGELAVFDGAWSTNCTLLAGPSSDLNLMVAKAGARARARVVSLTTADTVATDGWEETLICCIRGTLRIDSEAGSGAILTKLDVTRCNPEDGPLTCRAGDSQPALMFVASVRRAGTVAPERSPRTGRPLNRAT